jgi:Domain of unknown function (DUF4386)
MPTNTMVKVAATPPRTRADRQAAIWIGVLFIIGTVALVLSLAVTDGVLTGPGSLDRIVLEQNRVAIGALLVVVAALALAMVPVVFWPIGRRYDETLAMGYVVFRGAIETVFYIVIAGGWLVLISLSREPAAGPLVGLVRTTESVISNQLMSIPFALGALMFYVLLFQARIVPRWLSTWGLAGAALYLGAPVANVFGLSLGVLMAPLALQEMVLAVWLIAKGFDRTAISAESAGRSPAPLLKREPAEA